MAARLRRPVAGPLAGYGDGLRAALRAEGYAPGTVANYCGLLAQLSDWLAAERLAAAELTEEVLARFVAARRAAGYQHGAVVSGLVPLLRFVRAAWLLPAPPPPAAGPHAAAPTGKRGSPALAR